MGTGNVTNSGTFVTINFTAKETAGVSSLVLSNVGVTNETSYVSVSVSNGSVQVDTISPVFDDASPSTGYTGNSYTFNVSVTDNTCTADELTVMVDWTHGSNGSNESMMHIGGNYFEKEITLDLESISDMTYTIYAVDSHGNSNSTTIKHVTVVDDDVPSIDSITGNTIGTTGETTAISATFTDNIGVTSATLHYKSASDGSWSSKSILSGNTGIAIPLDSIENWYYYATVDDDAGNGPAGDPSTDGSIYYTVAVTDNDAPIISNVVASPSSQEIGSYVNVSTSIEDNIDVEEVYLNITYPDNSFENISITANTTTGNYYCNRTYDTVGSYDYTIWAEDANGNGNVSDFHSFTIGDQGIPEISNVSLAASDPLDTVSSFGWINISCDVVDNGAIDGVFLNITKPDYSWSNISMNVLGDGSFYYNSSTVFSQEGNYSYIIWSNDTSGNANASSSYDFSLAPNWDVDMNGECKVFDLTLISNHYGEIGTTGWIREDVDNNGEVNVFDLVVVSNHYNTAW
jgi:hypothetical protein